jgi:hypothetical protein
MLDAFPKIPVETGVGGNSGGEVRASTTDDVALATSSTEYEEEVLEVVQEVPEEISAEREASEFNARAVVPVGVPEPVMVVSPTVPVVETRMAPSPDEGVQRMPEGGSVGVDESVTVPSEEVPLQSAVAEAPIEFTFYMRMLAVVGVMLLVGWGVWRVRRYLGVKTGS